MLTMCAATRRTCRGSSAGGDGGGRGLRTAAVCVRCSGARVRVASSLCLPVPAGSGVWQLLLASAEGEWWASAPSAPPSPSNPSHTTPHHHTQPLRLQT